MKAYVFAALAMLGLAGVASAQEGAGQWPGMDAVGRLQIAGQSSCTGTLIAPQLVLTAAHCLYDPRSGARVKDHEIEFLAGQQGNRVKARRQVVRAHQHGSYRHASGGQAHLGHDLAVLKLSHPISADVVRPLRFDDRPEPHETVGVVSYNLQDARNPRLQVPCDVLARRLDVLVMSCPVEFGASGAPVLLMRAGKVPRLVSVISSKAVMNGRHVSVGTMVDRALPPLIGSAG